MPKFTNGYYRGKTGAVGRRRKNAKSTRVPNARCWENGTSHAERWRAENEPDVYSCWARRIQPLTKLACKRTCNMQPLAAIDNYL